MFYVLICEFLYEYEKYTCTSKYIRVYIYMYKYSIFIYILVYTSIY